MCDAFVIGQYWALLQTGWLFVNIDRTILATESRVWRRNFIGEGFTEL